MHVAIQLLEHYLLKRLLFLQWMLLAFLSKISWPYRFVGLFLESKCCLTDWYVYPWCKDYTAWLVLLCTKFWNQEVWILLICFFFQMFLTFTNTFLFFFLTANLFTMFLYTFKSTLTYIISTKLHIIPIR